MEAHEADGHLLGDSGYASKTYLLTPYLRPESTKQRRYNFAHAATRVTIEQAFGQLKRRFYILGSEIRVKYTAAPRIIMVCVMLHNLAKRRKMPTLDDEHAQEIDIDDTEIIEHNGSLYRDNFVERYF